MERKSCALKTYPAPNPDPEDVIYPPSLFPDPSEGETVSSEEEIVDRPALNRIVDDLLAGLAEGDFTVDEILNAIDPSINTDLAELSNLRTCMTWMKSHTFGIEAIEIMAGRMSYKKALESIANDFDCKIIRNVNDSDEPDPFQGLTPFQRIEAIQFDRQNNQNYGDPARMHWAIGYMWRGLLQSAWGIPVPEIHPSVVMIMMVALKLNREVRPGYRMDDFDDATSYNELARKAKEEGQ